MQLNKSFQQQLEAYNLYLLVIFTREGIPFKVEREKRERKKVKSTIKKRGTNKRL